MARGVLADKLRVKHLSKLDAELDWIMEQPANLIAR